MPGKQASIGTLDRGLDILECLQEKSGALSLSEIAEKVGLSPSTVTRLLATLEKRGYVLRDPGTKLYSPGPRARSLRDRSASLELLIAVGTHPMQELRKTSGESISLYIPRNGKRVCVKRVESSHPLRQVVNVGDVLPISRGAGGKVLCAWLEAEGKLDPTTLVPPLAPDALREIRENGYSVSFGERESGTYAIAAPVFDSTGKLLASLSLAGPIVRFEPEKLAPMSEAVRAQARLLSQSLDWKG